MRNKFLPGFCRSSQALSTYIQISKFIIVINNHRNKLHVIFLSPKKLTPSDGTTRENTPQNLHETDDRRMVRVKEMNDR